METITNKTVNVHLDKEKGTLILSGLLENTMVFLYDSLGELVGKYQYCSPSIMVTIPYKGPYVMVISHPNCQPEVRKIIY